MSFLRTSSGDSQRPLDHKHLLRGARAVLQRHRAPGAAERRPVGGSRALKVRATACMAGGLSGSRE
eukprot:600637-Alexandrium_andersonii.AAC.1